MKNRPKPYRVIFDRKVEKYAEDHSTVESELITNSIQSSGEEPEYFSNAKLTIGWAFAANLSTNNRS